ncbi:MAG: thioredoxin domain-containing protein [Bacteroidetes bacterium]|nr:thioredoxin domain-containing protein [Bacteroidota bacterium]
MTNRLSQETSPYLLQHQHNPVDWYPWTDEAWQRAKTENKLVIISIGYSACHWCHVMERECFENDEVAKLMNENYICIKVDREERPDVDQLYMDACNLMIGRGGWPLNAFALPDGRPVYTGTYFPRNQWMGLLREIGNGYKYQTQKYIDYAEKLMRGIHTMNDIVAPTTTNIFDERILNTAFNFLAAQFDRTHGGKGQAPKFMMPGIWQFLLRLHDATKNEDALKHTFFTLDKMATAGIYDQLGGGFARYSTDEEWKVPHFEKMLYDNAQLLSLYAEGYQINHSDLYKKICYETTDWILREMTSPDGGCYAALDADSEGEEGKFYVWKEDEIDALLGDDAALLKTYFGVGKEGYWEHGNNILVTHHAIKEVTEKFGIAEDKAEKIITSAKEKLFAARAQRIKPGLDNKVLTSWNALTISGFLSCYEAFGDEKFLTHALRITNFINQKLMDGNQLYRTLKNGEKAIPAFLEDYAFFIQALIDLYQLTFDEAHLLQAKELTAHAMQNFFDDEKGYCYFTSKNSEELVAGKIELSDNIMPAPNSVMAHNLFTLGKYFDDENYLHISQKMLGGVLENLKEHPAFYNNWGSLLIKHLYNFHEVAIVGEDALTQIPKLNKLFPFNRIMMGATTAETSIPLLQNKYKAGETNYFICVDKTCGLPVRC